MGLENGGTMLTRNACNAYHKWHVIYADYCESVAKPHNLPLSGGKWVARLAKMRGPTGILLSRLLQERWGGNANGLVHYLHSENDL